MDFEEDDFDDDELDDGSRYGIEGIGSGGSVSSPSVSSPHVSKGPPADQSTQDDNYDAHRYDSARGWEPKNKYKKLRDEYLKKNPDIGSNSMLAARSASKSASDAKRNSSPGRLFGDLWREGELAVLFAGPGIGKSILAVQIAESIARGKGNAFTRETGPSATHVFSSKIQNRKSKIQNRKVLYIDLERSENQFRERYSAPSPIPGKLSVRYRFSRNLIPAGIRDFDDVPAAFKGDINKFLIESIRAEIRRHEAKVVIIDSISYLAASPRASEKLIKSLHLWTRIDGLSILAVAHSKNRAIRTRLGSPPYEGGVAALRGRGGSLRPLSLADISGSPQIAQIADSIFAIGRSTFGEDIRYIKHLKSNSTEVKHGPSNVLVYRLERVSSPSVSSPHVSKGLTTTTDQPESTKPAHLLIPASPRLSVSPSPHLPVSPPADCQPPPADCFLGLTYVGTSPESRHHRDPEAEYREAERREMARLRKARNISSREVLVAGILDGSYARYLKE